MLARCRRIALVPLAALACVACSKSSITSSTSTPGSDLLSPGISPDVSHLDRNTPVTFANRDSVTHSYASAPGLGFGPCAEADQISAIEPGAEHSIMISRSTICAFEDLGHRGVRAFQGLLVVH